MKRCILYYIPYMLFCVALLLPQNGISQDLEILSIRRPWLSQSFNPGNRIRIEGYIANKSSGAAGESYIGFYLSKNTSLDASDIYLGKDYQRSKLANVLSTDFEKSVVIPSSTPSGQYYLLAVADVDVDKQVAETNENNNVEAKGLFTIGTPSTEKPDLTVSRVFVDINRGSYWDYNVTQASRGDLVRISYEIYNQTSGNVDSKYWVTAVWSRDNQLDSNDEFLGEREMPTIAGLTKKVDYITDFQIPSLGSYGDGYIIVVADVSRFSDTSNKVDESDENNNFRAYSIRINSSNGRTTSGTIKYNGNQVSTEPFAFGENIVVYPNPTANRVNIKYSIELPSKAYIYNLSGKVIWKKEYEDVINESINLDTEVPGMYVLKIVNARGAVMFH